MWGIGKATAEVGEALGGNDPESEYPDVPGLNPDQVVSLLVLLSGLLGNHLFAIHKTALEIAAGSDIGAPARENTAIMFGFPPIDAHILAR